MLDFITEKKDCVGCTACASVCPVNCIVMKEDVEGFLYPESSDKCIHCGKCSKVCPIQHMPEFGSKITSQAFAGLTNNNQIWLRSASGGAFSELCRAWDDGNASFAGAEWNGLQVQDVCVDSIDDIPPLCKSKYIASSMGDVFRIIKARLDSGKKVLFCGTPCQVAGLKNYLHRDYDNLMLVDLICHGVGSPKVFQACILALEEQFGGKVLRYEFRAKHRNYETDHIQKISAENGRTLYLNKDPYIQLFLSQKCLRPSCGKNCKFRNENRQGDITIADFKGIGKVFPELIGEKKNYSSIVINTAKGASVLGILKQEMKLFECSVDDIKEHNPLFYRQTWFAEDRDIFFKKFINDPLLTVKEYTEPATVFKTSFKRRVWDVLPVAVRRIAYMKFFAGGGYR